MGVGLSIRKFSTTKFSNCLVQLVNDQKMKERASLMGQRIRSENGVQTAINNIYRDLKFATERIQQIAAAHAKASS